MSNSNVKNTLVTAAAPEKELPLLRLEKLMRSRGLNVSLPCAVFDEQGRLIGANRRMKSLLLGHKIKLPMDLNALESLWPFSNEHDGGPALLRKAISHRDEKEPWIVLATAGLKTFKLKAFVCKKDRQAKKGLVEPERMIIAEMVRSGDLLGDRDSRQALFRTLSHEIRTSIMAMNGYLGILEAQAHDVKVVQESTDRLKVLVKRMESVVKRLDDFKIELGIFQDDSSEASSTSKRGK